MKFNCARCGKAADRPAGHVNRSRAQGNKLYCGRRCSGLGRRKPKKCKCGLNRVAHYPMWIGQIHVVRRWHKIERHEDNVGKDCFALDEAAAKVKFEHEADFFRSQTRDKNTEVFSAEVVSVSPARSHVKCKEFRAVGAAEFDKYYCGCHGWD